MSDVTISYNGGTIATMDDSGTKTLLTEGKYCEDDIEVAYVKPSAPIPPKLVLQYTLAEDFTTQATTDLATITSDAIQAFFDTHLGVRGSFPSGSAKRLRIDVHSDVTPAPDYSYITHFWYEDFVGFNAAAQVGFTDNNVVVRNGYSGFLVQSTLYTLHPVLSNVSGGTWVVTVKARCTGNAQFSVWKAGTYTFTIDYLGAS